MLIDEVKIKIKGGDGGNGVASFKNTKMSLGPTGGDGGNGGDVYILAVSDLGALRQFRHKKRFAAENGTPGSFRNRDGANGEDMILKVPVGTVVKNLDLNETYELTKINEKILVAHGASGGYGNFHFRSSTNISPRQWQPGHKAREFEFYLELKLIADVGLIGFPNAGKSSLINHLTASKSRVANYHFTTLEPYLGSYYGLILADIPGLIEGASEGRGLGTKFLRHVARCKVLFHLVSSESDDLAKDYKVIKEELKKYSPELTKKDEYVFLSKSDLVDNKQIGSKISELEKVSGKKVLPITIENDTSLKPVRDILTKLIQDKTAPIDEGEKA